MEPGRLHGHAGAARESCLFAPARGSYPWPRWGYCIRTGNPTRGTCVENRAPEQYGFIAERTRSTPLLALACWPGIGSGTVGWTVDYTESEGTNRDAVG